MLLKTLVLLPHLFCNVEFEFSWFCNTGQLSKILVLETKMLLGFQSKTNIEIIEFWLMYFWLDL